MTRRRIDPQTFASVPTIQALSVALGVSPAQVQRFIAEGIPRAEDKSFPLPAVVNWLQDRALRRGEGKRSRDPGAEDDGDGDAPRSWKVRKERAQALRYEFELEAKLQGWLERDKVEAAFATRLQLVAEGLKNLASYLGKRLNLSTREQSVVDESADRLIAGYRGGSIVELVEQWQESAGGTGKVTRGRGRPRKKGCCGAPPQANPVAPRMAKKPPLARRSAFRSSAPQGDLGTER